MKKNINQYRKTEVSVIKDLSKIDGTITIDEIYDQIKNGQYKATVERIRRLNDLNRKEEADKAKKSLLGFTASGVFNPVYIINYLCTLKKTVRIVPPAVSFKK